MRQLSCFGKFQSNHKQKLYRVEGRNYFRIVLVHTTDKNVAATNEDIRVKQIGQSNGKKKAVCSNQYKSKDIRTFFTHQSKHHEIRNESNTRQNDVITID